MRYILIFILATLLFGCGGKAKETAAASDAELAETASDQLPSYPTETVILQDVNRPVRVSGRILPIQEVSISSQVPGKVLPMDKLPQAGKSYRQGETIVRLDHEQLLYTLQAERSQLVTNLVRLLSTLSLDYAPHYPQWERFTNSIKANQLLPPLPDIKDEQLQYFISTNGIPGQYYRIKAQETLLREYTIAAPFTGTMTMADVSPGSIVQPGQVLAKLSRTDAYEVVLAIPANALINIKVGQRISLIARNLNRRYEGSVLRFAAAIDENTQTVNTYVLVKGPELRNGLFLEAEFPGTRLENVAVLPKEALNRDGTVYHIVNGTVHSKAVTTLLVESDKVYLAGLEGGEQVITVKTTGAIVGARTK